MGLDEIYIWCEIQVGDSRGYYDPDHHISDSRIRVLPPTIRVPIRATLRLGT
jgi:hypothetical protein